MNLKRKNTNQSTTNILKKRPNNSTETSRVLKNTNDKEKAIANYYKRIIAGLLILFGLIITAVMFVLTNSDKSSNKTNPTQSRRDKLEVPAVNKTTPVPVKFELRTNKDLLKKTTETLTVSFVIDKDIIFFIPPAFEDFYVITGPTITFNRPQNWNSKYSKSYVYTLRPKRSGVLTIGKGKLRYKNREYFTLPQTITVE